MQALPTARGLAHADGRLEEGSFISTSYNVRFKPPRKDWRVSVQSPYPGILIWMRHATSGALLNFTGQTIPEILSCKFPTECQGGPLAQGFACSLRADYMKKKWNVSEVNVADVPWFDFDNGKKFLRQAVVAIDDRVYTFVLSTKSKEERLSLSSIFARTIRTVQAADGQSHSEVLLDPFRCSQPKATTVTPPPSAIPAKPVEVVPVPQSSFPPPATAAPITPASESQESKPSTAAPAPKSPSTPTEPTPVTTKPPKK